MTSHGIDMLTWGISNLKISLSVSTESPYSGMEDLQHLSPSETISEKQWITLTLKSRHPTERPVNLRLWWAYDIPTTRAPFGDG